MDLAKILKKLGRYTNIPRLQFEFESDEYVYMADTMAQLNEIISSLNLIELSKRNLRKYKNDIETIENIKEMMKYNEDTIKNAMEVLEENYIRHCYKLNISVKQEEEEDENEL